MTIRKTQSPVGKAISSAVMIFHMQHTAPCVCNYRLTWEMGSLTRILDYKLNHDIIHFNYSANVWVNNNSFFPTPIWMMVNKCSLQLHV